MIPAQLTPYLEIGAHIFPLPAGQKEPRGIINNWRDDATNDRAQIEHWAANNPGCNWAMSAAASGLIVIDVDTKSVGRNEAWRRWFAIASEWGISPNPTVSTPSGGWHIYARVGRDVDPLILKQPALVKGIIDVRANGYVLCPPSVINGRQYVAHH